MTDPICDNTSELLIAQGVEAGLFPPGTLAVLMPAGTPARCYVSVGEFLDKEAGKPWAFVPWNKEQWGRFDRLPLVRTWLAPLLARRYGEGRAAA